MKTKNLPIPIPENTGQLLIVATITLIIGYTAGWIVANPYNSIGDMNERINEGQEEIRLERTHLLTQPKQEHENYTSICEQVTHQVNKNPNIDQIPYDDQYFTCTYQNNQ